MDDNDRFGYLLGTAGDDEEFHRLRIMFCLRGDAIEIAVRGSPMSHLEWFDSRGWVAKENIGEFLENNIRGFYLPGSNELYCYKGVGWNFDEDLLSKMLANIKRLKEALGLNDGTKINLGPKAAIVNGLCCERKYIGTLKELAGAKSR